MPLDVSVDEVGVGGRPYDATVTTPSKPTRDPRKLRQMAVDLWFAVQRMGRRDDGPDEGPDDLSPSGVPRKPPPSSGSASAAVSDPAGDGTKDVE